MQMTAALHLVPDPDDETPPPDTAGEQRPALMPTAAPAAEQEPGEELHDADEPGEELDDEEEAPAPRRALVMPDLRPYADLAAVPRVITAGVTATRRARAQRAERRKGRTGRLLAIAVDVAAGTLALLRRGTAWLGGEYGPASVKGPGRFGLAFLGLYFGYRTVDTWPLEGTAGLGVVWLGAALGERHRQRAQTAKASPETAEQTPARRSWWSRLTSTQPPAGTPEQGPDETAGDSPAETGEETPAEAAAEPPSREAIATALHHLVGEGRGVLLTTLSQHLQMPHTRALREVLTGAGIRVRPGVRTAAGNGPGIHRADFPPPPPSPDPAPGDRCLPRSGANANANNADSGPQKGFRADGTYWPEGRDYHFEPHPTNPHGTVIVYHHGED